MWTGGVRSATRFVVTAARGHHADPYPALVRVTKSLLSYCPTAVASGQLLVSSEASDIRYMPDEVESGKVLAEAVLDGVRYDACAVVEPGMGTQCVWRGGGIAT